jgi:hypothetical protein
VDGPHILARKSVKRSAAPSVMNSSSEVAIRAPKAAQALYALEYNAAAKTELWQPQSRTCDPYRKARHSRFADISRLRRHHCVGDILHHCVVRQAFGAAFATVSTILDAAEGRLRYRRY